MTQEEMNSEQQRISHSIDAMCNIHQVVPTFKWINVFAYHYKDVQGVQEKQQILLEQLRNVEL